MSINHQIQPLSVLDYILGSKSEVVAHVNNFGISPLVAAMTGGFPEQTILRMLEANTECAKVADIFGALPIHYAIRQGYSDRLLLQLLMANPGGARLQDPASCTLPIHDVVSPYVHEDLTLLEKLVEYYPAGLDCVDTAGSLPLHRSLKENMSRTTQHDCDIIPLPTFMYKSKIYANPF